MSLPSLGRALLATVVLCVPLVGPLAGGCAAVYPELETRIGEAPAGMPLDPPPPDDRYFLQVLRGHVPERTRDGRTWDQLLGSLPDPYAKVLVNGVDLFRTNAQSDTLEPTWPGSPSGNYRLAIGDEIEVQLWDSNALNDRPIGVKKLKLTSDLVAAGEIEFQLSGGGDLHLAVAPAKAVWGVGLWYELRNDAAVVTRVLEQSPAARAGLLSGDRVLQIDGKPVDQMSGDDVRSRFGSIPAAGLTVSVQHADGATLSATLKEGPIYPLVEDYRLLPAPPK